MDPVCHCHHLVGEEEAGYFAFLYFVTCALSIMVCSLPLGVIKSLCSVIVGLPWHILYYFAMPIKLRP